ncbi:MAG TPA: penicillin-binding protein 2 [Longimicrobiales bacterium]
MQPFHLYARRRRAQGAVAVILAGMGGLALAFFQTQVVRSDTYALQSEANRLRPLPIPAPRGTIYDRNGRIVAENIPGYALSLLPAPRDTLYNTLQRLAPILGLTEARIAQLMEKQRAAPVQPLLVSSDLTFEQVSALEERHFMFPGVYIDTRPKRHYPAGEAVAHLIGYVAEISEAELQKPEFADYTAGQLVGKAGLERQYEHLLGGWPGVRYIEVDALGRIVGEYAPQTKIPPVPGKDLHLYLDLDLQEWIAKIFPDDMRGAVVAIEPGTGHVLAMYSSPGYDPNQFVGGVDPAYWRQLTADGARPLLHRAAAGLYPPGSTFKLATAAIALDLGLVDPDAYMPIPCRGGMAYGNRYFRCWEPRGHGYLNLADALANSCNVYFYQLGVKIGLERFLKEASRLGFTRKTGVDLPPELEAAGRFPDGPGWWRERFGYNATPTEVLSLAIGQGPNDQTPLKMAHFAAALAGNGKLPPPRIAADSLAPAGPDAGINLNIAPENLARIREGMRRVVSPGGTAHLSSLEHWDLLGKTGTAQNPHGKDHAWFIGIAGPKGGAPEIALAAIVEFGESGSRTAAPLVAKAADYYLRRRHGMPVDSVQTLREHLMAGRPAPWAVWE